MSAMQEAGPSGDMQPAAAAAATPAPASEPPSSELMARCLMPPPPPRVPKPAPPKSVVDEDSYTGAIEAIIERDYFPDVPKMRSQLEWLQAVKSGDPARIKQAQINIAHRRAGLRTPTAGTLSAAAAGGGGATGVMMGQTPLARPGTGAGWATPGTSLLMRTPAMTPLPGAAGSATPGPESSVAAAAAEVLAAASGAQLRAPPGMGLDSYLSQFTSEDNASFAKVVAEENKRKKLKYGHHLDDKSQPLMLTAPAPTDEYGTTGQQPMTLAFSNFDPHNNLYYYKGQVALTDQEKAEQSIGPPKAVVPTNTRLPGTELDLGSAGEAGPSGAAARAGSGAAGFDRLATPSFTPGRDGFSPLMTWGELGSTPLRLDGSGLDELELMVAQGVGSGPFQVQQLGRREQVLHKLAHSKSGAGLRKPSPALALLQQGRQRAGTGGRATPVLTPAARALANKLKGGAATPLAGAERDEGLRASYRRGGTGSTPASAASTPVTVAGRAGSRAATPLASSGKAAGQKRRPTAADVAAALQGSAGAAGGAEQGSAAPAPHLTDDLLKL